MDNFGIMDRARQILSAAGRRAGKLQAANSPPIRPSKETLPSNNPRPVWMLTEARVTKCHHELVRTSALTLRITNDPNKLTVSFTYYAHARTYHDNFISPVAKAPGDTFSVYYNAFNPRQNTQSPSESTKRRPRSDIAMLGVILISILVLSLVQG